MTHLEFQQFIARNKWIFAKSYAAFCPHEYVVRDRLSDEEQCVFKQIVAFIRETALSQSTDEKTPISTIPWTITIIGRWVHQSRRPPF